MTGQPRGALGRVSWGLGDQAITSLVSFVVGIYVARSLGVVGFGAFSLAWVTYGVALNISRGLATDPLAVRYSGVRRSRWRAAAARSSGTALVIGGVLGLCCIAVGSLLLSGPAGAAFVALGLVLPGLVLQDSWRFAFFAAGQGRRAVISDITWAVALIPLLLVAAREPSVTRFMLAWGGAATIAAIVSGVQAGIFPRPARARSWLSENRDLGMRYLVENVSSSGAYQLRAYGLGAISGLAAVGTVRGAELMLGPFLLILSGVGLVAVPEAVRALRRSAATLRRFCILLGGAQAAAALVWGALLIFAIPDSVGRQLLDGVWDEASALFLPATLSVVFASISTGAAAGLRALGLAPRSFRAQLAASSLYVTLGLLGAAIADARGSAWGVAAATLAGVVIWWTQLRAGLHGLLSQPHAKAETQVRSRQESIPKVTTPTRPRTTIGHLR